MKVRRKTKEGAAAFYIVAIATLVLVLLAVSFSTVIISGMARTSNDDLSQSAYDSALAGVEDAKLALKKYMECINSGATKASAIVADGNVTCGEIIYWAESGDCDSVAHILGRIGEGEAKEVIIGGSSSGGGNNLNQAYTCVKLRMESLEHLSTLTADEPMRVVRVRFKDIEAQRVKRVKVSWYIREGSETLQYNDFFADSILAAPRVTFKPISSASSVPVPPTLQLQMVQTAKTFSVQDINSATTGGRTDRATVYMVPINDKNYAQQIQNVSPTTYIRAYNIDSSRNEISKDQVAKTNDRSVKNLPFGVYCDSDSTDGYICTAIIELPDPIGGDRNNDTFTFAVSLPYKQPETDFRLEFLCSGSSGGETCPNQVLDGESVSIETAVLKGQMVIDSTGRANDLYRRIEIRMEPEDRDFTYPFYAVEVLGGNDDGAPLSKDFQVTTEYNF
ncbi:MAG: hypothetical protein Q4A79_00335 [Candidatus Saccharibacteria bacterium]|nr:hypothetical protein [Candidatus Saccharibacteria bacterium]